MALHPPPCLCHPATDQQKHMHDHRLSPRSTKKHYGNSCKQTAWLQVTDLAFKGKYIHASMDSKFGGFRTRISTFLRSVSDGKTLAVSISLHFLQHSVVSSSVWIARLWQAVHEQAALVKGDGRGLSESTSPTRSFSTTCGSCSSSRIHASLSNCRHDRPKGERTSPTTQKWSCLCGK